MMYKKILLLFWLFGVTLLYGCDACRSMPPKTDVSLRLHFEQKRLTLIGCRWRFSMPDTAQLLTQYDLNHNNILDPSELQKILVQVVSYAKPRGMLMKITYTAPGENGSGSTVPCRCSGFKLSMHEGHAVMTYDAVTNLPVRKGGMLSFVFEDSEGVFDFRVLSLETEGNRLPLRTHTDLFTAGAAFE